MRLTYTHFDFWAHHHAPRSLLTFVQAGKTSRYDARRSLHACINDHAGWKPAHENTIHLFRLHRSTSIKARRDPSLLPYCLELGDSRSWCFSNAPRRSAWARRWARRIARDMGPEHYAEVCRRLAYSEAVAQYRAGRPTEHYAEGKD